MKISSLLWNSYVSIKKKKKVTRQYSDISNLVKPILRVKFEFVTPSALYQRLEHIIRYSWTIS